MTNIMHGFTNYHIVDITPADTKQSKTALSIFIASVSLNFSALVTLQFCPVLRNSCSNGLFLATIAKKYLHDTQTLELYFKTRLYDQKFHLFYILLGLLIMSHS